MTDAELRFATAAFQGYAPAASHQDVISSTGVCNTSKLSPGHTQEWTSLTRRRGDLDAGGLQAPPTCEATGPTPPAHLCRVSTWPLEQLGCQFPSPSPLLNDLCFLSVFFFFFLLFTAAPAAYGSSQARERIGTAAAILHHSHSKARSELHLQPTLQLTATWILHPRSEAWDRTHNLTDTILGS